MATRTRKVEPTVTAPTVDVKEGREHSATYASDTKNPGKYLIRVLGPNAKKFAGRDVPVTLRSGEEHNEHLLKCIWEGIDVGNEKIPGTGKPVALYSFEAKPREDLDEDIPF